MKTGVMLIGGGTLLGAYLLYQAYKKKQGAENLQFDIRDIGTPKFSGGLILPLQVAVINPSTVEYVIQYPTVRAYFKDGSQLGISIPKDENLTIKPSSQGSFPMEIKSGVLDILSLASGEIVDVIKNKSLKGKTILLDIMTSYNGIPIKFTGYEKKF